MQESVTHLDSGDVVAIVSMSLTFVTALVGWLTLQWRWHRRTEMEVALKRDMVERGLSAREIERVLGASLGGPVGEPEDDDRRGCRSGGVVEAIRARR